MDFILKPEMPLFPFSSILAEQPLGCVHLFPSFKLLGDFEVMGIRKPSYTLVGHFSPPLIRFTLYKRRYGFLQYQPGYSGFANVVKVSPVFSENEKGRALKKRGTEVLRTELEPSILEPSARKRVLIKGWETCTRGKNKAIILRKWRVMSTSFFL
jgi:hypothetical protein